MATTKPDIPKRAGYDARVVCHDHFDGSAHCVECGGHCTLTGADMAYTALVRAVFDAAAFAGKEPPYAMMRQMERSNLLPYKLWERAKQSEKVSR